VAHELTPEEAREKLQKIAEAIGGYAVIATALGVTEAMVSYIISGGRYPGGAVAKDIEDFYGIPASAWRPSRRHRVA